MLFTEVAEAINGERVLKNADYSVRLVAPPPELRKGCDLAVEVNLVEQPGIERVLREKDAPYVEVAPLRIATSELLEVVRATDLGKWTMVKSGNMKLAFDNESGTIVNTSGGGCPDIPHLHLEMVGKRLDEAPRPREIGYTLCALMLDRALEEGLSLWREEKSL